MGIEVQAGSPLFRDGCRSRVLLICWPFGKKNQNVKHVPLALYANFTRQDDK